MDVLGLSSSLSISKPLLVPCIAPISHKHQRQNSSVSCRATKVDESLYKILSLSPESATMDDIKRAYRSMALRYHPDVCRDPAKKEESTRMFVKLNMAYETLSDPRLRRQYDSQLVGGGGGGGISWRCRWEEQLAGLKRRPHREGSWGSRMRAQNL